MIFDERAVLALREEVSLCISEKRFKHTLGVEIAAARIGNYFFRDRICELRCAALLHDVAKELSTEEFRSIIKEGKFELNQEDLNTPAVWHSLIAPFIISRDFSRYASADILSSAAHHTLGDPDMSLFDKIIFISDYVEDGRVYEASIRVRENLYSGLSSSNTFDQNERVLNDSILMSIDNTIRSLEERGLPINSRILMTKRAILDII